MSGGIYLIQDNGELLEMNEQAYDSEDLLQGLIEKYPNLLAGDQINKESPRRWILVSREVSIASEEEGSGRWSVDHLFIDQDGIPTLVEVKRSSDTRIRREVVGQLLEYAANATVHWPIEMIREKFEKKCEENGRLAEQEIADLTEGKDHESFWQLVESNLKLGQVRLIFLADAIPSELKRIVEFLNEQMNPAEVLAIEVKQFVGNELKTLVPRVIGQTSEAQQKKKNLSTGKQWDFNSFMMELETNTDKDQVDLAKKIYEWGEQKTNWIWFGKGKMEGSFIPIFKYGGVDYQLFAIRSRGNIELYFNTYQNKPPFNSEDERKELLNKLNNGLNTSISSDAITKFPKISLSVLKEPQKLENFLNIYDWFIGEVRNWNDEH